MKSQRILLCLLALALAACMDKEREAADKNGRLYARLETPAEAAGSKAEISRDGLPDWTEDDCISVFLRRTAGQPYRFAGHTGEREGAFDPEEEAWEEGTAIPRILAVYPYHSENRVQNGTQWHLTLPATQTYSPHAVRAGAMVAATDDNKLSFKNICAFLVLRFYGEDIQVSDIRLQGNRQEALAGPADITLDADGLPDVTMGAENGQHLLLQCPEPVPLGADGSHCEEFWLAVPPTVFPDGFSVTVTDRSGYVFRHVTTEKTTLVRNTILRTAPVEVRLSKAAFSGGNGTETDPYLIAKAEDLQALASYVNGEQSAAYRQKHYCQTADIDLHAQGYFTPIGHTADHAFTGQYDGGFHTITGLGIRNTGTKPSALFGHCGSGSVLRGIRLQDVKIQTTSGYAAAVVAYDDAGEVRDCSAQGSIRSTGNIDNLSYTGGIAGRASRAQFTDCSFQGSIVASSNHAGGIIGEAENGCTIRDCRFLAGSSLQCNYYGGGITGAAGGADTEISGCVCEGDVSTSGWNAGGIAGVLYQGIISDCVQSNVSTVFSNQYNAGGIAGSLHTNSTGKNFAAQVAGCAVYGDICGQHQVGGIAGSCQVGNAGESATIARCGIRGATITAQGRDADGFSSAGGICGLLKGNGHSSIRHCFARPGSIRLTDKYAQGAAGGIAGRIMQGDAVLENCYSTLSPSSLLSSGQAAETGTGIAGSCPVAATLTDCHYLQDYRPAPADGKQHITDCYGFSRSDMTGGKLLETLNAHAPGIWETDAEGYPSVCQLPADTRESAAPKKRVSIIGDSISTFSGYLATGKYNGKSCTTHYPNASNAACDVLSVDQTWWHQLIYQYMQNARFERNISSGNTTVVQNTTATASASQYWYNWDFCTRFIAFGGVGAPDIVFIHGGTNDLGHISSYGASEKLIGAQAMNSPDAPDAAALEALFATADACSSLAQAEALDYSTFCAAYIKLIRMIQLRHPGAKIVCLIGDCVSAGMQAGIQSIAGHYGAKYVDFLAINGFRGKYPLTKYDGVTHPDANGMTFMAKTIYQQLGEWLEN